MLDDWQTGTRSTVARTTEGIAGGRGGMGGGRGMGGMMGGRDGHATPGTS